MLVDGNTVPLRVLELGRIEYARALELQERLLARRIAGEAPDTLLLLEHEPVYTLGRGADAADLRGAPELMGVPVFRVGRGGGVTYHGPGQMVAYPIVGIARAGRDVRRYVRGLEEALIATCARYGVDAAARPDCTGVWAGAEKIASIGIGVRRWVAYHGVALNVCTDLSYFAAVVPCRVPGMRLTTLAERAGRALEVFEVGRAFADCFRERFGYGAIEYSQP